MNETYSSPIEGRPPVFVAGCGRSGTTLVRTLINAHPQAFIPTECLFISDYLETHGRIPPGIERFLFYREPQLLCWYGGPRYDLTDIASGIRSLHEYEMRRAGATVWGQKTPRFIRRMDLFDRFFPTAKWVLVYRDPRAVIASMLRSRRHTYSVDRAVHRWKLDNAPIVRMLQNPRSTDNGRKLLVRYEGLAGAPEKTWREICKLCAIAEVPLAEITDHAEAPVYSRSRFPSNAIRDTAFPAPKHLHTWRHQLTVDEIQYIEHQCLDEMQVLGYVQEHPQTKTYRIKRETLRKTKDILIIMEYLRKWPEYLAWTLLRRMAMLIFRGRRRITAGPPDQ